MNRTEAIKKIEHSLATCEPQIITPAGTTYEEHVDRLSKKLLTEVIDPVRVKVTSTIIQGADFEKYRSGDFSRALFSLAYKRGVVGNASHRGSVTERDRWYSLPTLFAN